MVKLLTVVTSTYNKGDRNRASIQSILDQTFRDFDYIIVNDESPDNTKEILAEFDDPRLKIIDQENQGFVKTMISVLNQIETPYVAIQGAGDVSLSRRFELQINYLEARPEVAVVGCSTYQSFVFNTDSLEELCKRNKQKSKSKDIEYNTVDQMIQANIIDHGDAIIRMSAYREAGGYRAFFRYCQDRDLWLRILENKHRVVKLGHRLYVKIIDPQKDIAGNPQKAEVQTQYSLFSRYLANERKRLGVDPLDTNGDSLFSEYISDLDASAKLEIATKVYRNTMRSGLTSDNIEIGYEIIHKYVPGHFLDKSMFFLRFLKRNVPRGAEIYHFYYRYIQRKMSTYQKKISRMTIIFSPVK